METVFSFLRSGILLCFPPEHKQGQIEPVLKKKSIYYAKYNSAHYLYCCFMYWCILFLSLIMNKLGVSCVPGSITRERRVNKLSYLKVPCK